MSKWSAWCAAAATMLCLPAIASARTPCDVAGLPRPVVRIHAQLARAGSTTDFGNVLGRVLGLLADVRPGDSASVEACLHYLAGSAYYALAQRARFSSSEERVNAWGAIRHLVAAEARDPNGMKGREQVAQLTTAWSRLGDVPGWLEPGPPVMVEFPPSGGTLILEPAAGVGWAGQCGSGCLIYACKPDSLVVPLNPDRPLQLTLRAGTYLARRAARCMGWPVRLEVTAGPVSLPDQPHCPLYATFEVRDGLGKIPYWVVAAGSTISAGPVDTRLSPVRVVSPGYLPRQVDLPPNGGHVSVELERCPVDLHLDGLSVGTTVEGTGPGPWGPRTVRVHHEAGLREHTVEIPKPDQCKDAAFRVNVSALP